LGFAICCSARRSQPFHSPPESIGCTTRDPASCKVSSTPLLIQPPTSPPTAPNFCARCCCWWSVEKTSTQPPTCAGRREPLRSWRAWSPPSKLSTSSTSSASAMAQGRGPLRVSRDRNSDSRRQDSSRGHLHGAQLWPAGPTQCP
jgi:hypothetical protein